MRLVDPQQAETGSCTQGRGIMDTFPAGQMGLREEEATCCSLRIILIHRFQRAQTL